MLFEEMNRKTWEAYENSRKLYNEYPGLYWLKLIFLLLQSLFVLALIITLIIFFIIWFTEKPFYKNTALLIFLGVNCLLMVCSYTAIMLTRPWSGMLYLNKRDYPELYRAINWVAHILRAPKIHRIYISPDFNAMVAASFIFIPGMRRNVLILGYPLLCALSSKALLGCLAHEFGHLSRNHLSWRGIFLRIAAFWDAFRLGIFTWIFSFWINRFLKSLGETLHPLYYQHEIEAEQNIIDKLGMDYFAESLLQIELKRNLFANDGSLFRRIASEGLQNADTAAIIRELMQKPLDKESAETGIARAMKRIPPVFDEHPPFREYFTLMGKKRSFALCHGGT